MLDFQSRAFNALKQEQPVGEIRINQNVQVSELNEKGGMADPGDGGLAIGEFGKGGLPMLAGAPGQERLPNHLAEKSARVKVFGRR